jgi:hypothetical protein
MGRGGYIGFNRTPVGALNGAASGVWELNEVQEWRRDNSWPSSTIDPHFSSVSLQLPFNGTNGSTTLTDYSGTPKTVTAFGNAKISTAQSKYGGASLLLDGSGDYVSVTPHADLQFGTGDFTVEMWVYATGTPSDVGLLETRTDGTGSNGFTLTAFSSSVIRIFSDGVLISSSGTSYVGAWCHVAVTRAAGTWNLWINGVSQGTSTASRTLSDTPFSIGAGAYLTSSLDKFFPGYIDDFRVTKGVSRYTGTFTPPGAI